MLWCCCIPVMFFPVVPCVRGSSTYLPDAVLLCLCGRPLLHTYCPSFMFVIEQSGYNHSLDSVFEPEDLQCLSLCSLYPALRLVGMDVSFSIVECVVFGVQTLWHVQSAPLSQATVPSIEVGHASVGNCTIAFLTSVRPALFPG